MIEELNQIISRQKVNQIISRQKEFQKAVGFQVDSDKESIRNELSEKYLFKAIEEIVELRKEFPSMMNPWSKSQGLSDEKRVREELVDVLLFLLNFAIVWRITPTEILEEMKKVQDKNFEKMEEKKAKLFKIE
jgi:NTP pyrophosphatase (non-canonical NTP hydrolase)